MTLRPEFNTAAIPGLQFQPWIGDEYGSGSAARVRTLILGESHYGPVSDIPDLRDLTTGVVNAYLGAPTSLRLFKRVEDLFEVPDDTARRHAFWNSVAFANYIQVLLEDLHHRPTAADWRNARAPFSKLLHILEPDIVLVLGTEVWNALSAPGALMSRAVDSAPRDANDHPIMFRWEITRKRSALATWIHHPTGSRGFRVPDWQRRVRALLATHKAGTPS